MKTLEKQLDHRRIAERRIIEEKKAIQDRNSLQIWNDKLYMRSIDLQWSIYINNEEIYRNNDDMKKLDEIACKREREIEEKSFS
jgi:hypothetical protein